MCLIIFAYRPSEQDQDYELIVTANRDEAYERPTTPARFWSPTNNEFLAGQDKQAGGTWLGVDRQRGRFAALTNFWGPRVPSLDDDTPPSSKASSVAQPKSRGSLAVDFLAHPEVSAKEYMQKLVQSSDPETMNGFSLLVMDQDAMYYYNNRQKDRERDFEALEPGQAYGLSNGYLNSDWPKVNKCRHKLEQLLLHKSHISVPKLRSIVTAEDVGKECCHAFIKDADHGFGTVSNAVVMIPTLRKEDSLKRPSSEVTFSEHMYDVTGDTINIADFQWALDQS